MLRSFLDLIQSTIRLEPWTKDPDMWNSPTLEGTLSSEEIAVIRECLKNEEFTFVVRQICALLNEK